LRPFPTTASLSGDGGGAAVVARAANPISPGFHCSFLNLI